MGAPARSSSKEVIAVIKLLLLLRSHTRIRIGQQATQTATVVAGISGAAVTGSTVVVNSNGKLGVTASSARFKDEIKPMNKASEAILALRPVTFRYKQEIDPEGIPQFGLMGEDVEKVTPDLVARDDDGKPYTMRYEAVNAMLLNEFLKEHHKVEGQACKMEKQDRRIAEQEATAAKQQDNFTSTIVVAAKGDCRSDSTNSERE